MFKNPLKYQQGGAAPSQQEQQVLAAFIQWLPKRVKEFQGMQPEQIAQALDGMSKTPEGKKQLQQLMAQFQQEMQGGSQALRQGGKIHDFICKHAKGGNLKGCGCKQEGGTFESKDKKVKIENFGTAQADTTGTYSYPSTNGEFQFNPMGRTATVWGNTGGWPIHRYADQNWINRHPRRQMLPGFLGGHRELAPDGFFENLVERVNNRTPQVKRCGGKVRKGQDGFLNLWQRAYDSKFGKGLRNFMFGTDSDLSDEEYTEKHGYSRPIMGMPPAVKISYIPEGVYGSAKMAEQAAKAAKETAKFKHVSPLDGGRLGHTVKDVSGIHLKNNGGKVESADNGAKVNKKNKTVTNVNRGLSKYDAEELGIDPNTLVDTGSTITAFPNKKPYIVNGQVPFNKRNAIWFSLGGTESGPIEDGANIGGVPGRKYRVSQVGGQETNYGEYSNPEPYPYIIRYASPVDTMYNVGFTGYNNKSTAYPGIRTLYNAAIDSGNIVAQDEASHKELQRQKSERKQNK